ncbi:hypothetical protein ACU686_18395, partial [Yinghuangia aomiensis]
MSKRNPLDRRRRGRRHGRKMRGDIYNPATGKVTACGRLRLDATDVDQAVAAPPGVRQWRNASLAKRAQVLFGFRELLNARTSWRDHRRRARQGALPDALGGRRGQEVMEFACSIPQLQKGGFSEQASTASRRLDPPAARPGRDHRRSTSRRWSRCGSFDRHRDGQHGCSQAVRRMSISAANFLADLWKQASCRNGVFNVV